MGDIMGVTGLNAPYGARRFLTRAIVGDFTGGIRCLNAPYGARCFLTRACLSGCRPWIARLNAPYGARCFLTHKQRTKPNRKDAVLMHLMALSAF